MTDFGTAFSQLKLSANAQIKVAIDQLKESGQTTSVVYVDLAKSKVDDAWLLVEQLLENASDSERRALEAENKNKYLRNEVSTLKQRNIELEGHVDKLKEKNIESSARNTHLEEQLSEATLKLQEVTRERNHEQGKAANLQGQVKKLVVVQKELDSLKALNPQELRVERDQAVTKFNKEKTNHSATKTKSNARIKDLEHEVSVVNSKLEALVGQKQHKSIMGTDKKTRFHVREYQGSNQLRLEFDPALGTVDDLDWHVKVEAGNGICLHMGVSDFFTPLMPYSTEIDNLYPVELNGYLHKFLLEKLSESHPRHIKLIKAAKKEVLTTKKELFSELEIKWLQKARFITLFDACSLTFATFGSKIKTASGKSYDCTLMNDLYKKIQALAILLKREHRL